MGRRGGPGMLSTQPAAGPDRSSQGGHGLYLLLSVGGEGPSGGF